MASLFNFQGYDYLNIDATVGSDGVNQTDDVYLVQALLYEVLLYKSAYFNVPRPAVPTGIFNVETEVSLATYKKICNDVAAASVNKKTAHLYGAAQNKVYYDKHIDPIKGSIFAFGTNKLWALARLNSEILDLMVMNNSNANSVKAYMFNKYPKMIFMFR